MVFGYTPLDPLVVLLGTVITIWYLSRNAVKLLGFMPTALSLWFFVPLVTNLTLWQVVPLLLAGRLLIKGIFLPRFAWLVVMALVFCFISSTVYAFISGTDVTRALIRVIYYTGVLATLFFTYEMGRRPEAYEILLKGFVVVGLVYAAYGAYQFLAFYTGLPVRGIVYSATSGGVMAFEAGLLRINSFANEPKRLGYVLFISALACIFLARMRPARRARQLRLAAIGVFGVSLLTFAGSYYFTIAIFIGCVFFLYPSRVSGYIFCALALVGGILLMIPDLGVLEVIQHGYERRAAEVEIGLDGNVVYRQEFYAWDYLANNPLSFLTGTGVGQYFSVLNKTYGQGVGYNELGGLMPLNSNFLEMVFDFGVIAATLFYVSLVVLIFKLRRAGEMFFCVSLLFLLVQSLTILNLLFIVFLSGAAMGRLSLKQPTPYSSKLVDNLSMTDGSK